MKKAVEEVDKCRMTLKWTYAMAYYLAAGNQKDLFEDNQRCVVKMRGNAHVLMIIVLQGFGESRRRSLRASRNPDRSRGHSVLEAESH